MDHYKSDHGKVQVLFINVNICFTAIRGITRHMHVISSELLKEYIYQWNIIIHKMESVTLNSSRKESCNKLTHSIFRMDLLVCDTMQTWRWLSVLQRNLKRVVGGSSKMLVTTYISTCCHNPKEYYLQLHQCKNLKSQIHFVFRRNYMRYVFVLISIL